MESLYIFFLLVSITSIVGGASFDRAYKRSDAAKSDRALPPLVREPAEERNIREGADQDPSITEGDMLLTPDQTEDREAHTVDNGGTNDREKRKGLTSLAKRWPKGVVPYKIKPSAKKYKEKIEAAMDEWSRYTCLRFKPRSNKLAAAVGHEDFIAIDGVPDSVGCSSYIGYIAHGGQKVNLTDACTSFGYGTIIHELGHVIGYVHEQSRPDRDQYVTIHLENVGENLRNNFKKFDSGMVLTNDIPYDHASIMHYGSHFASQNDKTTIEVRHLDDRLDMGQRDGLSRYDIEHANRMYDCPEVNECETLDPCLNGGTCVDDLGTYHCECPDGYRGVNCNLECQDEHDDCNFFAGSGDCTGGEYQGWMLINCKKSCGICMAYECKDIEVQDTCDWAKEEGYCEHTYVDWMKDQCQKTCGFCNYCNPVPCLNGGACSEVDAGYTCTCADGFSGENCEIPDEPAETV